MKILFAGNGPLSNRGCEAIVLGIQNVIASTGTTAQYILASFATDRPSSVPDGTIPLAIDPHMRRWSVPWFARQFRRVACRPEDDLSFLSPLKGVVESVDLSISIGGDGYAIDAGRLVLDRLVRMDAYMLEQGIPVVIWGASIGPFSADKQLEREVGRHLRKIPLIIVREPESYRYLRELGAERNVMLAADPAFGMEPAPCEMPHQVEDVLSQPFCIGVNLSPMVGMFVPGGLAAWRASAARVIEAICSKVPYTIALVPHVTSESGDRRIDDHIFLRQVLAALPGSLRQRVCILPRHLRAPHLKWAIGRMHAFIGARTHSTIAAIGMGVPTISIGYSRKARGLNEMIFGHDEWLVPIAKSTPSVISERLLLLLSRHDEVRASIAAAIPGMLSSAKAAGAEALRKSRR